MCHKPLQSMTCVTTGCHASKAEEISNTVEEKFRADSIPWANAVSLSVDTTNSMIGKNNKLLGE